MILLSSPCPPLPTVSTVVVFFGSMQQGAHDDPAHRVPWSPVISTAALTISPATVANAAPLGPYRGIT